jgi:type VI secretion system protein ImpH
VEAVNGTNITSITDDLVKNGHAYNVWQAIRIGEALTKKSNPSRKDFIFDQAGLHFRPFENYEYPPTDIRGIKCNEGELTFILSFLGLYGINAPLPRCYHEQVSMQMRLMGSEEVPLKTFLDIFNDRFYWLYYQAWKKYKYHLFLGEGPQNRVSERINSFIGKSISRRKESSVPDHVLLKFAGILNRRSRNKGGLQIILNYLFPSWQVEIKEFVPRWIEISGIPSLGDPQFRLGDNSFIGSRAVDYMSLIRIEIGPLTFEEYLDFLPGKLKAEALKEILKLYLNDGLEYEIFFRIKSDTIESVSWNDEHLKLGSTIWLGVPENETTGVLISFEEFNKS